MTNFDLDIETKKMLKDISTTFGVKMDVVKQVWEYTIFTMMLRVNEQEGKLTTFQIPYIGTLGLRKTDNTVDEEGNFIPGVETFVSLNDNFKNLYSKTVDGKYSELSEYLQKNYINKVVKVREECAYSEPLS